MPVLIFKGTERKETLAWRCSACDEVFALESMFTEPSTAELEDIDRRFHEHCEQKHGGSPAIGLPLAS